MPWIYWKKLPEGTSKRRHASLVHFREHDSERALCGKKPHLPIYVGIGDEGPQWVHCKRCEKLFDKPKDTFKRD